MNKIVYVKAHLNRDPMQLVQQLVQRGQISAYVCESPLLYLSSSKILLG